MLLIHLSITIVVLWVKLTHLTRPDLENCRIDTFKQFLNIECMLAECQWPLYRNIVCPIDTLLKPAPKMSQIDPYLSSE